MSRLPGSVRRLDLTVLLLLLAILVFRLVWVLLVEPHALVKDAVLYDNAAHWFMDSGAFAVNETVRPSAWVVPGYSFFLSIVYWLFGSDPSNLVAVRIVQVILSVLTILVLYRVALRLQGRRLGIACVVLAGLYPPFILANEYVLTEVLYTFLLSLVVLLGIRLLDKPSWTNTAVFGVLLAVGAYVRPPGAVWGVVPFLLLLGKVPLRRVAALAAVALVTFCICLSPWWIRNGQVYDRFVLFTTNVGFSMVRGTYEMFDQEDYDEFLETMISRDELLTAEQEIQANSHYQELAGARIKDQLRHEPGKFFFGRIRAIADSFTTLTYPSLTSLAENHPSLAKILLRGLQVAQFLFLLVPAGAAVWIRRKDRRVLLLASLPVVLAVVYAVILILPRYIFPAMPVIVLLAAIGWLRLLDRVFSRGAARGAGEDESLPDSSSL